MSQWPVSQRERPIGELVVQDESRGITKPGDNRNPAPLRPGVRHFRSGVERPQPVRARPIDAGGLNPNFRICGWRPAHLRHVTAANLPAGCRRGPHVDTCVEVLSI